MTERHRPWLIKAWFVLVVVLPLAGFVWLFVIDWRIAVGSLLLVGGVACATALVVKNMFNEAVKGAFMERRFGGDTPSVFIDVHGNRTDEHGNRTY